MTYHSPVQMRAALAAIIPDDTALVEATITQYFRKREARQQAPKDRPDPKPQTYAEKMELASRKLGDAVERMLQGRDAKPQTGLQWDTRTGADALAFQGQHNPDAALRLIEKKAVETQSSKRLKIAALTIDPAVPCFNCGAARGCEHRV